MKDNFSGHADQYALYRPTYPAEFFEYLNSILPNKRKAWDVGTGNGQIAFALSKMFEEVYGTDISQQQIDNARHVENIQYSVQPAEKTAFEANQFDLVVIAQAIHWFDFEKFYAEVHRTTRDGALICVIGYDRIQVSEAIDALITDFYKNVIGPYWDKERKYIDDNYSGIPFPFEEIETPEFVNELDWSLEHLIGYLNTWSAVQHFIKENGYNPVKDLKKEIEKLWPEGEIKTVRFNMLLRIGRV